MRSPHAAPLNPPKTCEWMTPNRAQASIETGSSGTIGRWKVMRSPVWVSQTPRSSAANSFTWRYSSWYVIALVASASGSGTQMNAALFGLVAKCRSTQL